MPTNAIAPALVFTGGIFTSAVAVASLPKLAATAEKKITIIKANRKQFGSKLFGII